MIVRSCQEPVPQYDKATCSPVGRYGKSIPVCKLRIAVHACTSKITPVPTGPSTELAEASPSEAADL